MNTAASDSDRRRAYETALSGIDTRLRSTPADTDLLFERARLLTLLGPDDQAKQAYLALLHRDPTHFGALTNIASLSLATGHRTAALTAYRQAVIAHPENPAGLVNLANCLASEHPAEARTLFDRALVAEAGYAPAHQGLGQLLFSLGEPDAAERHWREGYRGDYVVTRPYRGEGKAIRLLVLASPRDGNVPTTLLLDDRVFAIATLFPEYREPSAPLPAHDLIFNTIADADLCAAALEAARSVMVGSRAPVINRPEAVQRTGRVENARRLARLPGVIAPHTEAFSRQMLQGENAPVQLRAEGFCFPLLLRPPGFQTGRHFIRVDRPDALSQAVAGLPDGVILAIEYLDAAGADGMIRKYRVMMIDGALYPLHMAASHDWKIHYFSSAMGSREDLRHEEEKFLNDMAGSLGDTAMGALRAIQHELALDYAGVDFGLSPDGRLILFEANATMIVFPPPENAMWDYRRPAIARALDAAKALLVNRAA